MRTLAPYLVLAALALQACPARAGGPPAPGRSAAPAPPRVKASASPGAASAAPGARKATPPVLLRPLAGGRPLTGEVRIDAAYFQRAGGRLLDAGAIASTRATIVAAGAGNAVPARLIGADGATLIGADGGSLIGADGATLVGADGGTLISDDGSTLIGNDGGTLISDDGSTLIGNDGGTYRLNQAGSPLAIGELRPAAGFLVVAINLADGKPLPIGQTEGGEKVYGAWTDAAGRFAIGLPAEVGDHNVRVLALAAGSGDARLAYGRFVDPAARELTVDEDGATVETYLRASFAGQLAVLGLQDAIPENIAEHFDGDEASAALVRAPLERLQAANRAAGVKSWPAEARAKLALRMADTMLARIDLSLARVTPTGDYPDMVPGPALERLDEAMRDTRVAVGRKLEAEALARAKGLPVEKPMLAAMQARVPGARLDRPSDYTAFVAREVLGGSRLHGAEMADDLHALNQACGLAVDFKAVLKIRYAAGAIGNGIGLTLLLPAEGPEGSVLDALVRDIETFPKP